MHVVIVGAGLGGLSAACHLAGRGHDVEVVEKADVPGGRAGLFESGGYRFDTGPSVLTMTGILADVFAAAGEDMAAHLTLVPVDPMYRACFADGSELRVWHDRQRMQAEIGDLAGPAEAEAFGRFCDWLTGLYRLELPNFIDRNFDSPLDLAWPLGPIIRLVRTGGFRKLNRVVESYFSDPRLQQIFSFQAMYAGLSPFEALALYCVITYMDTVEGVYFPLGGMHAISRGLATAAEKAGATFRYGTAVEGLVRPGFPTPGSRVTGVRLAGGEVIHADAVVLNPDLPVAYEELLPDIAPPRSTRKGTYSPSCSVWLAGVKGDLPEGAAHHNIHFGPDWQGAFENLLDQGHPDGRPVDPRHQPHRHRPVPRPARPHVALRPRAHAQPRRQGRLGHATALACATGSRPRWPPSATRSTTSRSNASSTLPAGGGRGWPGARRSPSPTTSSRRGPSAPATSTTRRRAWCSSAPAPSPGWACPWSCSRDGWPPTGWRG